MFWLPNADFCKTKQHQQNASNSPTLDQLAHSTPSQPTAQPQSELYESSSEPAEIEGIEEIIREQESVWEDAASDEGLDDVRDIPSASLENVDLAMLCDIQRILSRLVAKAPQVIGEFTIHI